MNHQHHIPVLMKEVIRLLEPTRGDSYLDVTAGYGGHAEAIKRKIGPEGTMTLVDRDLEATDFLDSDFAKESNTQVVHGDFLSISRRLAGEGRKFDIILADLGVSSQHLNKAHRGFSFMKPAHLDMRMDTSQKKTAFDIVNSSTQAELAEILKNYGEVKNARKLAENIIATGPHETTTSLSKTIAQFTEKRRRIHPSTQVFQALRIAVNDELEQLERSLSIWVELLNEGGRIGVISFHSLEDRIVKKFFNDHGGIRYDARLHLLTKKPVVPSQEEIVLNPRARSAKLRCAQRK